MGQAHRLTLVEPEASAVEHFLERPTYQWMFSNSRRPGVAGIVFRSIRVHKNNFAMNKEKENRSSKEQRERGQEKQKGATSKTNGQTGGSKRHERDDSNHGADRNTTKKQENSI